MLKTVLPEYKTSSPLVVAAENAYTDVFAGHRPYSTDNSPFG